MTEYIDEIIHITNYGADGFIFNNTSISKNMHEIEINGDLSFAVTYNGTLLKDEYKIQILFPLNYPKEIPIVKEVNNRIPSSADYHNNKEWSGFCLGVPGEIHEKIHQNPTFKYFISEILVPFLYANTFFEKYKRYPWQTRPHYEKGLIEYYQNLFKLKDERTTKEFLLKLAYYKNLAKGHIMCPCGSNKKFRNCHQKDYLNLLSFHSHKNIQYDVYMMIKPNIINNDLNKFPTYSKKWYKIYKKHIRQTIK